MAFFKTRQAAWDQIKASVADAADSVGDRAGDLRDAAADAHERVHARVRHGVAQGWDAVQDGASATADAVRSGTSAVGRGAAAVGDGVERTANGVIAGAIAGAFASWMMNQFQAISAKPLAPRKQETEHPSGGQSSEGPRSTGPGGDDATVKVAQSLSQGVAGHDLAPDEKLKAGAVVHYGYGAAVGALYGGLAEIVPGVSVGMGIPYGLALWLLGDEIAVPALGLSPPPTQSSPSEHAAALSAHFVYGITLDLSRRVLRHIV